MPMVTYNMHESRVTAAIFFYFSPSLLSGTLALLARMWFAPILLPILVTEHAEGGKDHLVKKKANCCFPLPLYIATYFFTSSFSPCGREGGNTGCAKIFLRVTIRRPIERCRRKRYAKCKFPAAEYAAATELTVYTPIYSFHICCLFFFLPSFFP